MATPRCPGQDRRFWKPQDIFEVRCPYCAQEIEFWKDEPFRYCAGCGKRVNNPRVDLGCAKWCKCAPECLGTSSAETIAAAPVIDRLLALLAQRLTEYPERLQHARAVHARAEALLASEGGEPSVVKAAALFAGALLSEDEVPLWHDVSARKTILEQAGIAALCADHICAIVEAVISGNEHASAEFAIVWDAVQLEKFSRQRTPDLAASLKTATGKRLFAQERFL